MSGKITLRRAVLAAASTISLLALTLPARATDDPKVDPKYIWDLSDYYKSPADWDAARAKIKAELPGLAKYKGTLAKGPAATLAALEAIYSVYHELEQVGTYASTIASTDTRDAPAQERDGLAQDLSGEVSAATAWLSPEIQALGAAKVDAYLKAEPKLAKFGFALHDALRLKPHTLGAEAEGVLAALSPALGGGGTTYNLLSNADIDWPTITLPNGQSVKLTQANYQKYREDPDRAVRKAVFDAFWTKFGQYSNTMGSTLGNTVQGDVIQSKLRHYPSAVAASLSNNDIPEGVYRTLVAEANKGLPTLYRYFKLRQRMLNLPDLHYYDIYPPLVSSDAKFPVEEGEKLVLAAVKPLGDDYQKALADGFAHRWMHAYPQEGKQSGAYQTGVYGLHPVVFLNYQDNYNSVSTLAHEWGHAMHTTFANRTQPYELAGYSLFMAEIASTANEFLLSDYMLANAKTKQEKLLYLGNELETIRATFFRQTMFAEFELQVHDAVEKGEPMSGKRMTEIYLGLLRKYHGADQGVMQIDPVYAAEWAFIPHFYRPFYVYQYATSISASAYFTEKIRDGGPAARDTYLAALKAGGSDYPVNVLRKAGLDMASPAPYQALVRRMDAVITEMERLLDQKDN
ncbi:oligoendopeptidase F [Nitrospirillum amazonense]|uniref:oligoendopeptidase F n=1 Tax=Nitrospirillum amazonense TaxID=28077 RepID=UPI00241233E4|nr:oligoendopeptidase F [Nitrospirillum amazonense]MDG3441952.1 oligoendopeptidase F [Nitrospirillum amazonense]